MTRRILLLGLAANLPKAFSQRREERATRSEKVIVLGDSRVRILVGDVGARGRKTFIYFHPHENEHGSAVVTRHTIGVLGGRLIEIRSQGERLIGFKLKGVAYSFDPNRMFTDAGLESSLAHFAPISSAALDCARGLRTAVLKLLGNGKIPIIAVHNTAEDGITALSFRPGGPLGSHAAKVALNPKENASDFFVVLDEGLFMRLHHAGFNTVLRSPDAPDDGSLSYFCQQHNWSYVTVEAAESDMNQQQRMLDALPATML